MTAARKIDKILESKGISRRQLAISAGIPPSTLQSAFERNKEIPLSMLTSIADALGVSIYYVLGDEELARFYWGGYASFFAANQIGQEESGLLSSCLAAFMMHNGYTVSPAENSIEGDEVTRTLYVLKHTYSVKNKDGKEIVLSLDEMLRLEDEISDMIDTRLKYLFKEKGVDNG